MVQRFAVGPLLRRAVAPAVVLLGAFALVAACGPAPSSPRSYVEFSPSEIDPAIDFGETALSTAGAPVENERGRLVVLFAGSGGGPKSVGRLTSALVDAGFHVIGITYDSSTPTLGACPDSASSELPDCHRTFRGEVVFGEQLQDPDGQAFDHPAVSVSAANSAMNGLMKQLDYVRRQYPLDGWEQFQQRTGGVCDVESVVYEVCEPRWEDVTLMGFSQGGAIALYISKFFGVARVGILSAPFDAFSPSASPTVAPWISDGGFATAPADIAQLVHVDDNNVWRQRAVADSLGLTGAETLLKDVSQPISTNRLASDIPPVCSPVTAVSYHNATAGGSCTDVDRYREAWIHLAGGN